MSDTPLALVSTDWLSEHLNAPDVRVVDASLHLPHEERDGQAEYEEAHIPGAVFFDIKEISDLDNPLPHMMPSAEKMSSRMRALGIGDGNRIIVYDNSNVKSAARCWYMLKSFSQRDVAVLDGGFQKWKAEGRATEDIAPIPRQRHFSARFNTMTIRSLDHVRANLETAKEQVIDARGPGRFSGKEPEIRDDMKSGHIPGSLNVPFSSLLNAKDGTFLPPAEIQKKFEAAGVDLSKPVITSCGSGITAAVLALGLYIIGHRQTSLYDGSWSEWGAHPDVPVETLQK